MNLIEMAEKASLRAAETAKRFGVEALFLNAPMRQAAGVEMTAAVSEAGGLGVLAAAHLSPEKIVQAAQAIRNRTEKPFAVSLAIRPRHYPQAQGAETLFDGLAPLLEDLGLAGTPEAYDLTGATVFPDFDEQFEAALSVAFASLRRKSWKRKAFSTSAVLRRLRKRRCCVRPVLMRS